MHGDVIQRPDPCLLGWFLAPDVKSSELLHGNLQFQSYAHIIQ